MDFSNTLKVSASGFEVQRKKMDVIIENLANMETTRTPEGGPYLRKIVLLSSEPISGSFGDILGDAMHRARVEGVLRDNNALKSIYDPNHPDADGRGFLSVPAINAIVEMADMIMAHRAYEASVTAFEATKNMAMKTLEMGR